MDVPWTRVAGMDVPTDFSTADVLGDANAAVGEAPDAMVIGTAGVIPATTTGVLPPGAVQSDNSNVGGQTDLDEMA